MVQRTLERRGVRDARVLAAMRKVPRERFMRAPSCSEAYADGPAPIGSGQTISQPYIVAYMSEAVAPQPTDRCLEIGTGSGYQAAVLAELCAKVYSIEVVPDLGAFAEANLRAAGYGEEQVALRVGDGYDGWPDAAPFDIVVITAAPPRVPRPLLEQLAVGGRLIAPVGPDGGYQELVLHRRTGGRPGTADDSDFERQRLLGVRFVPFVGKVRERPEPPGGA
ncbi:MAG: protein-L-isoaspartate(D-aspartate) O-methyltransferase [Acidobacteria bacterium]|nr:MAG: protein-L-isoaspartate(D-aspartate) O-methyltransferase [Acidobacteriota bacterium]REK07406.1 MAG: protein-L-isoaspartate(D-aspartate) O-methyltransferase [Acidobacteriota bacterium]